MRKEMKKSNSLSIVLMLFSVISTILMYTFRFVWVFVDSAVGFKLTLIIFILMILNAFTNGILVFKRLYSENTDNKKSYKSLTTLSAAFTALFTLISVAFLIVATVLESGGVAIEYFKASFLETALFALIPAFSLFLPALSNKAKKISISIVLIFSLIFALISFFPITPYKITSDPMVIDNGYEYSVVFATSANGTGYITYTFGGEDYKVYDESGGRLNYDSKIHSIAVPYEHLKNNSYKVGSIRVLNGYSYGSRIGKEIVSAEYDFTVNESNKQTYLTVSDWHTNLNTAYKAIEHLGQYDSVILLGDASPGLDFENEAVKNIVEFAGKVSGGTKPVIYARGNHETRGNYGSELLDALGLREFYYKTKIGDFEFIVLDSGEDKDDTHPEYGGLTNYNDYRKEQLKWLQELENDGTKTIALSHAWQISEVEEDISDEAWKKLDKLGVSLMISGHTHECRFIGGESEREAEIFESYPDIIGYMDGGISDAGFVASVLTFTDENILIKAYSDSGETVFDRTIKWR